MGLMEFIEEHDLQDAVDECRAIVEELIPDVVVTMHLLDNGEGRDYVVMNLEDGTLEQAKACNVEMASRVAMDKLPHLVFT